MACHPGRKTYDLSFPTDVASKFLPAFVCGLYDGDGSWVLHNQRRKDITYTMFLQITSANESFLESLRNVINFHCKISDKFGLIRANYGNFDLVYKDVGTG